MPSAKPKPSEIATEAKREWIPYIKENFTGVWEPTSYLIGDSSVMMCSPPPRHLRCAVAVEEGDPVDIALDWADSINVPGSVPVISMANEQRPGGDWELGIMAQEECLCRRSNLVATLSTPASDSHSSNNYPIPPRGGIFSPNVVVFRCGPDRYQLWSEFKVISVAPVRRPKLDRSGKHYSFDEEKELMRDKIRTCLRISVYYGYPDICLSAFGIGNNFRNPVREVATMWRDALFSDEEFNGHFSSVVFAFDGTEKTGSGSVGRHGATSAKGKGSAGGKSDLDIWRETFDPSKMFENAYR